MPWRLIYESFGMYIAFVVGCIAFMQLNRSQRLLFAQVALAVLFYFLSHWVVYYQRRHQLPLNNLWVLNLYNPMECLLLAFAAYSRLTKRSEKWSLGVLFFSFLGICANEFVTGPEKEWHKLSFFAESLLVILVYAYLLYQLIHQNPGEWKFKEDFWMMLGLLIYFAVDSPYIMLFNYFNEHYRELNGLLYDVINNFLANLRYLLLALGFWLVIRKQERVA